MRNGSAGNVALEKSYDFALKMIRLGGKLQREQEFVLSRQLARSGTSIGANIEEAQAAQTRPEFHTLMSRAEKEMKESHHWLRLIRDSFDFASTEASGLLSAGEELKRILAATTKSTKR